MKFWLCWNITQRRLIVTDVSGQTSGPFIKGQIVQEECQDRLGMQLYRNGLGIDFFSKNFMVANSVRGA